ncbi:MAG: fatty acid desaturase [Planctomycetota bacterium]
MRDSKAIIRHSLDFATEQRGRSWWHLVSTLLVLLAVATTISMVDRAWLQLPLAIVMGLVLVRVFIVYHDYRHGTILKDSRLAQLLLNGYGLLVLNPPSIWSRSHEHHHRNVGKIFGASIGSYPVMTREGFDRASPGERRRYLLQRHPLSIAAGYLTIFLYGMCVRSLISDPRKHWDSAVALVLHAAIVTALALLAPALLPLLVIVPMTVACGLGAYLFYAQHNYPEVVLFEGKDWTYLSAALASSSYLHMGPVMRWFTGNIGFHHVHHVNSKIPFYRLPEAMAAIHELQQPGITTLSPRQVWRCLRLRVWDPELGRMTA